MASNIAWNKIICEHRGKHNFDKAQFVLTAGQIKKSCQTL